MTTVTTVEEIIEALDSNPALHARDIVGRRITITTRRMGFRKARIISEDDLVDILNAADTSGISRDDLYSFDEADIILRVTDDQDSDSYIPVEVSFTVHTSDVGRAVRNAEYLTSFTGLPARPAVAGVRIHHLARDLMESNDVFFYGVSERLLRGD